MAHAKSESLLELARRSQAGHRTQGSVGRTDEPAEPGSRDGHWKRRGNVPPRSHGRGQRAAPSAH